MQSLIPWRHLHQWVKQKTADLQRITAEITNQPPFSHLTALAAHVEERFHEVPLLTGQSETKEWLTTLGTDLRRVELDTEEETRRVRSLADKLAGTRWHETPGLEIIPYIDGTPAGTPRKALVVWLDHELYVDLLPKARLARCVPEEIGKLFGRTDIKAALDYSYERSSRDVRDYLEENFKLAPLPSVQDLSSQGPEASKPVEPGKPVDPGKPLPTPDTKEPNEAIVTIEGTHETGAVLEPEPETDEVEAVEPNNHEHDSIDELDVPVTPPRTSTKPARPAIIELFAKTQGYRKDGDQRYFHDDGSWIGRTKGDRFPWERRTAAGDLVYYYWSKDHCLEREPLQIDADIWALIDNHPEKYALILSDSEGDPVEITGASLRAMREEGKVTLYPATYRLVLDHDHHV